MCKKLLSLSRLFVVVVLISLLLLTSACDGFTIVHPSKTPRTPQYTLTVNINGNGSISKNLNKSFYNEGESVQVSASPNTGWRFESWSGDDEVGNANLTNPITISMDANKTLTANFVQLNIYINSPEGPSSGEVNELLTFVPGSAGTNDGNIEYRFDWGDGSYSAWSSSATVSHSWTLAGIYSVKDQAQASGISLGWASGQSIDSEWSAGFNITITAPPTTTTPTVIPNVRIQSVTLPSGAQTSGPWVYTLYSTTIRLVNSGSVNIAVNWQANSSVTGNFDSGSVTVPANSYVDVTKSYYYTVAGAVNLTYTIYYNGSQLDTWSGTMNVIGSNTATSTTTTTTTTTTSAIPNMKIQSVTLPSGAKTSSGIVVTTYPTTFRLVNSESFDITVNWQAHSSVTGNFGNGSVTVPKNGYVDVTNNYYYTVAGVVNLTYTIYYNSNQIDTWSGTMNVLPGY